MDDIADSFLNFAGASLHGADAVLSEPLKSLT